ncbi:MAG: hypothetical protein RR847_01330 [Bacilli bacterium]
MKYKDVLFLAQVTLMFGTVFFGILAIYNHSFLFGLQMLLSLLLFIMAINNYMFFKTKVVTYIYLSGGLLFAFLVMFGLLNG